MIHKKLLVKPVQQVQEFLCFPQVMPDVRPLGEICLLAEDLLDPFSEYMLEFHQDGKDPISLVSDMLTPQLSLPFIKKISSFNNLQTVALSTSSVLYTRWR